MRATPHVWAAEEAPQQVRHGVPCSDWSKRTCLSRSTCVSLSAWNATLCWSASRCSSSHLRRGASRFGVVVSPDMFVACSVSRTASRGGGSCGRCGWAYVCTRKSFVVRGFAGVSPVEIQLRLERISSGAAGGSANGAGGPPGERSADSGSGSAGAWAAGAWRAMGLRCNGRVRSRQCILQAALHRPAYSWGRMRVSRCVRGRRGLVCGRVRVLKRLGW